MKNGKVKSNFYQVVMVLIDIILINLGLLIGAFAVKPDGITQELAILLPVMVVISAATYCFFNIYGLYKFLEKGMGEIIYSIALSLIFITLLTAADAFFTQNIYLSREVIIYCAVTQLILVTIWRYACWNISRTWHGKKTVLILGREEEARNIASKINSHSNTLYDTIYMDPDKNMPKMFKTLESTDEVVIGETLGSDFKAQILSFCIENNIKAYVIPKLYEVLLTKSEVSQLDDIPVFKVNSLELTIEQRLIKRVFDIAISFAGLIIALPVMLLVAAAIKLDSKGPVFYCQERITRGNKAFKVIKFRTMTVDAEKHSGPVLATKSDSRITRVGHFIRATRLDELPQIINVLKGEMSFIGPRPERQYFIDQFEKEIPDYNLRHSVKAGITGVAQVMGKYTTSAVDKLRYDLMYIRRYSILTDLKIIFQTVKILFMKESSSGVDLSTAEQKSAGSKQLQVYSDLGVSQADNVS